MANSDITYCNGVGCMLKNQCKRHQDGQRIKANVNGDTGQYWWMDNCDQKNLDGFLSTD